MPKMTKRLNSKYKACKKIKGLYKNIWGVVKSSKFRSVKILKRNIFSVKLGINRLSPFHRRFNVKQSLKSFYSHVSERYFKELLKKSIQSECKTINKLISLLESRVDVILFRARFVNSLHMARQLINHGFVYLNSKKVFSKSQTLFAGDCLELKNTGSFSQLVHSLKNRSFKQYYRLRIKRNQRKASHAYISALTKVLHTQNRKITPIFKKAFLINARKTKIIETPKNLEVSYRLFKVVFLWEPVLKTVYYPVPIQYKKHFKNKFFNYSELIYND